jgi:protein-L-isoaspartate(D-aspartate) O-methyltransferase
MIDWEPRAVALADELEKTGKLTNARWREALLRVPRHVLVPEYFEPDQLGGWRRVSTAADEGLDAVYSNKSLTTDVDERGHAVSSSSMPGLMVRMLELLEIEQFHRVLEVGTGTGYNAALITEYLGDGNNFFSIDIDYVDTVRERLTSLGYRPTLRTGDGIDGLPDGAPYDRIIATVAVPRIPPAWVKQLSEGGLILADIKVAVSAGNLVLLHKEGDTLTGRFDRGYAAFMAMRHPDQARQASGPPATSGNEAHSATSYEPMAWENTVVWFLAALQFPRETTYGMQLDSDHKPTKVTFSGGDGSWARVDVDADANGERLVVQSGPTKLWDVISNGYRQWDDAGRPTWDRFGLTVKPDGRQIVWLDDPAGEFSWLLP